MGQDSRWRKEAEAAAESQKCPQLAVPDQWSNHCKLAAYLSMELYEEDPGWVNDAAELHCMVSGEGGWYGRGRDEQVAGWRGGHLSFCYPSTTFLRK